MKFDLSDLESVLYHAVYINDVKLEFNKVELYLTILDEEENEYEIRLTIRNFNYLEIEYHVTEIEEFSFREDGSIVDCKFSLCEKAETKYQNFGRDKFYLFLLSGFQMTAVFKHYEIIVDKR